MVEELGDVIINARNVLSRRVRNRDRILTIVMWVLYAYLWLPLISLGAWYLGVQFAYDLVLRAGGLESLLGLLFAFVVVLLSTALAVIVWSWIQRARFAKSERRVSSPILSAAQEQAYWGLEDPALVQLKSARRLVIELDNEGRLRSLNGRLAPDPAPSQVLPKTRESR